ncbi:TESK1 [Symbiodinium sp. CCMP2592]|nr:TESK1 [Symbiodinium sp. CCMP2592]
MAFPKAARFVPEQVLQVPGPGAYLVPRLLDAVDAMRPRIRKARRKSTKQDCVTHVTQSLLGRPPMTMPADKEFEEGKEETEAEIPGELEALVMRDWLSVAQMEPSGHVGSGAIGEIFRARLRQTGQTIILKKKKLRSDVAKDFLQEAVFMHASQHPNIARVLFVATWPSVVIGLEDLGPSLAQTQSSIEPQGFTQAFTNVARAVAFLHCFVAHRDLKPHNILHIESVCRNWEMKLIDFDAAEDLRRGSKHMPGSVGTYAPLFCSGWTRVELDVYAVGVKISGIVDAHLLDEAESRAASTVKNLTSKTDTEALVQALKRFFTEWLWQPGMPAQRMSDMQNEQCILQPDETWRV